MTEEEFRNELKKVLLGARQHGLLDETEVSADDMCVIGIGMVFDLFKQAGWVQLDDDQSLPEPPYKDEKHILLNGSKKDWLKRYKTQGYCEAQQDMLNANFRKVK